MEFRNNILIFIILLFNLGELSAQQTIHLSQKLIWVKQEIAIHPLSSEKRVIWRFEGAKLKQEHPELPLFSKQIIIPGKGKVQVSLANEVYQEIKLTDSPSNSLISGHPYIYISYTSDRDFNYAGINFLPLRRVSANQYEKLVEFDLIIRYQAQTSRIYKNPTFTETSVLSTGELFKIQIPTTNIYKIDYQFLEDSLHLNPAAIDPRNIKLYAQNSGPLPEPLSSERVDDLRELSIFIEGENDGSFDAGDYIIFYGPGPDGLGYDDESNDYKFVRNPYTQKNFVFLKISPGAGKRVQNKNNPPSAGYVANSFEQFIRYEEDKINLLGDFGSAQGSGQRWFGPIFTNQRTWDFTDELTMQDVDLSFPLEIIAEFAGRSKMGSEVILSVGSQEFSEPVATVNTGDIEALFARIVRFEETTLLTNGQPRIAVNYPEITVPSEGWLDFIQLKYRRMAIFSGTPLILRDKNSLDHDLSSFQIQSQVNQIKIWDISDPHNPLNMQYLKEGERISFSYDSQEFKEFLVFDDTQNIPVPGHGVMVENQNLHGILEADFVIIFHPDFESAAKKLANHRVEHDNLIVEIVNIHQLYNEFSSGKQDPTAIRDFAKMLFDRSDKFRFLLLLGDGSYDYRNVVPGLSNQSFVPVYETKESLNPLSAFPTDDYFALLNDNEGGNLRGALDISVGRLPVKTEDEANKLVDKIIGYDLDPNSLDDWRTRIAFLADDEDTNIHLNQADNIAKDVNRNHPLFNQEKIYFDAFPQESTPGGARYPQASEKFNNLIFKGLLVANYLGHGGPKGWSQERVLMIDDITSWRNESRLPLIITATCSFTGFDDPGLITAGEHAILHERGGAVALFSTVRSVYSSQNFRLTKSVFDTIFTKDNGQFLPIGEALRRAKNSNSADTININARKFLLIGDPSMTLAIPELDIQTKTINAQPVNELKPDTIKALQKVEIEGFIKNSNGGINTGFNGIVHVTVFDKESILKTLSNDPGSPEKEFTLRRNIVFKGSASVNHGEFKIAFVVPVDINYNFGRGRISYYASDGSQVDAAGVFEDFIIGGTDSAFASDHDGPLVEVFLNDENFVTGGITDNKPVLLVKLSDENGINQSGTSIGHDIVGILDGNTQNTLILNDFYSATVDDFRSGLIRFPLAELETGNHKIVVKAFDIANNPGEGMTEFTVVDLANQELKHVLNYPNPFTTSTNFSFEHDLPNVPLKLSVDIYTLSGKLVKSIRENLFSTGFRINDIHWNGADDFGNNLARGIYLYKIKINSEELNISKESSFEKLVILR